MEQLLAMAEEAPGALRAMGRHGIALAHKTQEPVACEWLRHRTDECALARCARIRERLGHLEDAILRPADQVHIFQENNAHPEWRAIA